MTVKNSNLGLRNKRRKKRGWGLREGPGYRSETDCDVPGSLNFFIPYCTSSNQFLISETPVCGVTSLRVRSRTRHQTSSAHNLLLPSRSLLLRKTAPTLIKVTSRTSGASYTNGPFRSFRIPSRLRLSGSETEKCR